MGLNEFLGTNSVETVESLSVGGREELPSIEETAIGCFLPANCFVGLP